MPAGGRRATPKTLLEGNLAAEAEAALGLEKGYSSQGARAILG